MKSKFKFSRRNFFETSTFLGAGVIISPFINSCISETVKNEKYTSIDPDKKVIECDVLVCGAGPSGFTSAISAARNGAKVILIERYGFPGGMLTAGFVQPIYGFFSRHIQVVRGIAQEFIEELKKVDNATLGHKYRDDCVIKRKKDSECISGKDEKDCPVNCVSNVCAVDSEIAKVVLSNMLQTEQVKTIFHSTVIGIKKADSRIKKVLISNKSGFQWIHPKIIIDATGDADVAALAGVDFEIGDNGVVKPPTLMFQISGVKHTKDRIKIHLPKIEGETSSAWLMALPGEGNYTVNSPSLITKFDSTDIEKLSEGQFSATNRALNLFFRMKENIDFLSDIKLKSFATNIGIRDSRRIKGLYTLTDEDVLNCRKFPESGIANGVHPIDLHVRTEKSGSSTLVRLPCGDYYQIPYKTMIPENIDNLIVTGRSISASFHAQGSARVMGTCMMLGEAAGIASSFCVEENKKPEEITPMAIREKMIKNGAYLGFENDVPMWNKGLEKLPDNINNLS